MCNCDTNMYSGRTNSCTFLYTLRFAHCETVSYNSAFSKTVAITYGMHCNRTYSNTIHSLKKVNCNGPKRGNAGRGKTVKDRPLFRWGIWGHWYPRHIPRWLRRLILEAHMYRVYLYVHNCKEDTVGDSAAPWEWGVVSWDSHVMVAGTLGMRARTRCDLMGTHEVRNNFRTV